ncbi:MAG: YlxR family protein [Anaerolineaceae bacterium]|nr:YlxR family protein [Anaerolineaceae bacterium]
MKKAVKVRHIPQRTCVGCRQTLAKRTLIRLVRTAEGVKADSTGKVSGRGAYLHDQRSCWEKGLKGSLAAALKTTINESDLAALKEMMERLPSTGSEPAEEKSSGLL